VKAPQAGLAVQTKLAVAMAFVVLTAGCSRKPPAAAGPVAQAPPPAAAPAPVQPAAATEGNTAAEAAVRNRELIMTPVHFDYDSFDIRADSRQALEAKVPLLGRDASIRLRISGHADERGSTEYNVALGMRRAITVKEYLQNYRIDGSRLEVTSYGEERPAQLGSNEAAWSRNRRAEFEILAGLEVR
jgi:peptidoglycan-associated lipoprotein